MTRGGRRYKFVRNGRNEIVKDADGKPVYSDKMANGFEPSRIAARRALREGAMQRAADVGPIIKRRQAEGATPLRAIAAGLNAEGIRRLAAARGQLYRSCAFFSGWRRPWRRAPPQEHHESPVVRDGPMWRAV